MADEADNTVQTAEEKYAPQLPKQLRDQMASVEAMMGPPRDPDENDENGDQNDENGDEHHQDDEGGEGERQDGKPPQQGDPPPESWEQRARSTLGRLEQAVNTNQLLSRRISDLEREITTLRVNGEPAPAASTPKPKPQYVKPEELNDYGEEFFDVVGRKAKEEFAPLIDTLEERIKRIETGQQAVGKVVEQGQKRGLYDTLHDEVPEWREINHHPAFKEWLTIPDPYSGRQRHEMLQEAFSRHDANRVVNFFRGFLTEATGSPPNVSSQNGHSAPPLANGNASGKPSLEDFAAPGRARSGPQELPPDRPVYTAAWIAKFSADKRTGKYRGREAEAEAIERDIFQAQHEGRIH
jgi:hypothetical protein